MMIRGGFEEKLVQKAAAGVAAGVVGGESACKLSLGPVDVSIRTSVSSGVHPGAVVCACGGRRAAEDDSAVGRWAPDRF